MTRLCVSLTEKNPKDLLAAMRELPEHVDTVEVRLDYLTNPTDTADDALRAVCERRDCEIIATNRPVREGGKFQGEESARLQMLRSAARMGADFIDVELDSVARLGELQGTTRRIVSHHDFRCTPSDLASIHRESRESGADVVKIATLARNITDCARMFGLLERCSDVDTIGLCMGEEGLPTRVLAPKFGAFLSFCSLDPDKESAAGQVPYDQMEERYHFSQINPETEVFGVVANPVAHSMSPPIHNAAFAEAGMDAVYLPLKVAEPEPFLDAFQEWDLRGLSVTIPHKEAMIPLMDELDDICRRIGALNTVDIRDGFRRGSNTDVAAAISALRAAAKRADILPLEDRNVLLIGAGGAGRALAYGLSEMVGQLTIANRTVSRAERLAREVDATACGLGDLEQQQPSILVNTTSVGMYPNVDDMPVPASILREGMVVFDAVYNPIETRLLREAKSAGCVTASGFEWFVSQAAAQFETWTDLPAPREVMARVTRRELEHK